MEENGSQRRRSSPGGPRARARRRHPRGDVADDAADSWPTGTRNCDEILSHMEQDEVEEVSRAPGLSRGSRPRINDHRVHPIGAKLTRPRRSTGCASWSRRGDDLLRVRTAGIVGSWASSLRDLIWRGRNRVGDVMIPSRLRWCLAEPGRGGRGRRALQLVAVPVVDDDGPARRIVTVDDGARHDHPTAWKKRLPRVSAGKQAVTQQRRPGARIVRPLPGSRRGGFGSSPFSLSWTGPWSVASPTTSGRDHHVLDRRRALGYALLVGDPREPGRPVLHPGSGRTPGARKRG